MSETTPQPVSWFLIEPGWKVVAADLTEVGRVEEVTGDSTHDIFNGLAIVHGLLGKPRYVPSELVGAITEGRVELTIGPEEVERLTEFDEPPTTAEVLPDAASRRERIEEPVVAPIHDRPEPVNVWRRLAFWLRNLFGR